MAPLGTRFRGSGKQALGCGGRYVLTFFILVRILYSLFPKIHTYTQLKTVFRQKKINAFSASVELRPLAVFTNALTLASPS